MPPYHFSELETLFLDALDSVASTIERSNQLISFIPSDFNFSHVTLNDKAINIGKKELSRWIAEDLFTLMDETTDLDVSQISTQIFGSNTNVSRSLYGLLPSGLTFPNRNKDEFFPLVCGLARSNEEFRDFFFANISTPLASALHSLQDTILADFENDSPELNEDIPMPDLKRRRKVEEVSTEEGVDIKRFKVEESSLLKSRKKTGTSKNIKKKSVSRTRISEKPYRKTSKLRERDTLREVTDVEMSFAVEPSSSRTARHLLDPPFSSDSIPSPEISSSNEDSLQVVQISESTFTPQVSPALVHDDPPSPLSLHTPAARYSAEDVALDTDDLQSARSTDTTWPNHNPPRLISNRHSFQSVAQAVAFWNQPSDFPINPTTATTTTTTTTTTSLLPRASPIRVSQWRPDSVWFSPPRSKPTSSPPLMSATSTSSTPSPPSPISRAHSLSTSTFLTHTSDEVWTFVNHVFADAQSAVREYVSDLQDGLLMLALAYELSHLPFLVLVFVLYLMYPDGLTLAYAGGGQIPLTLTVRFGSSLG